MGEEEFAKEEGGDGGDFETFHLRMAADGVYRVHLTQQGGTAQADAFVVGHDTIEPVRLPPGDYVASITDPATGRPFGDIPITLTGGAGTEILGIVLPMDDPVLADLPAEDDAPSGLSSLDQRASLAEAEDLDEGDGDIWASTGRAGVEDRRGLGFHNVGAGAGKTVSRFAVGLSEDRAPGSVGGWQRPEGLSVEVEARDRSIHVFIRDQRHERRSRVRLTLSVAGLPSVRVPIALFREGVHVGLGVRSSRGRPDFRVEVRPEDPRKKVLMDALQTFTDEEALKVLEWSADATVDEAIEILLHKKQDLWAATAAALLLIKAKRFRGVSDWYFNLARLAPHIADADIAAAWVALAIGGDDAGEAEARSLGYLRHSRRTGAPNFVVANSLLLELLNNLRVNGGSSKIRDKAAEEYKIAVARSRFRLFETPYMIWERDEGKGKAGRLDEEVYEILAEGKAGTDRLELSRP